MFDKESKKTMKKLLPLLLLTITITLAACSSGGDGDSGETGSSSDSGSTTGGNSASSDAQPSQGSAQQTGFVWVVEPGVYYDIKYQVGQYVNEDLARRPYASEEGRWPVRRDGKWGYVDMSGNEVIPPQYDQAGTFSDGLAFVNQYGRWGVIDLDGNEVVPFVLEYKDVGIFRDGLAGVGSSHDPYPAVIDASGKELALDERYSYSVAEGGVIKIIKKDNRGFTTAGLIDRNGETIIPIADGGEYHLSDSASNEAKEYLKRLKDSYTGPNPPRFFSYGGGTSFREGLSALKVSSGFVYVDTNGDVAIPFFYDYACEFHNGMAMVMLEGEDRYAFFNMDGEAVTDAIFDDDNYRFYDGMAAVRLFSNKWGFIDMNGDEVIPPQYDAVTCFYEGIAFVMLDDAYFFIDKAGNEVSERFDRESVVVDRDIFGSAKNGGFFGAVATEVEIEGREYYGILTEKGEVVPPIFYDIDFCPGGVHLVYVRNDDDEYGGGYGLIAIQD
jgi:hypothetical protein